MTNFQDCRNESQAVVSAWVGMMFYYRGLLPLEQLAQDVAEILGPPLASPGSKQADVGETRRVSMVLRFKEQVGYEFDQDLRELVNVTLAMLGTSQDQCGDLQHAVKEIHQLLEGCPVAWALVLLDRAKEVVLRSVMLTMMTSSVRITGGPPGPHERVFTKAVTGLLAMEALRADGNEP